MRMSTIDHLLATDPARLIQLARQARVLRAAQARDDINVFMEYVMRDERDDRPDSAARFIRQMPHHRRMQEVVSEHKHSLIWSHLEAGKTHQISIGRTLWELGRNPNLRFGIFSSSITGSQKIARTIGEYISSSVRLHEVFPNLRPGDRWSDTALTVKRSVIAKDPSVECAPQTGKIQGARLDRAILDDVVTDSVARSESESGRLWDWFHRTVFGRAERVIVIGNAYRTDDFMHRLEKNTLWKSERFPLLNTSGESNWPAVWPKERIEIQRKGMVPEDFARQFMCLARDDGSSWFKREYIDVALARGEGKEVTQSLAYVPNGYATYTGVDLGHRKHKKSDLTVLFTYIQHPSGMREVLEIKTGRWGGPEIVREIESAQSRFHSTVYVENVAAQQFIVDFSRLSAKRVVEFQTDSRKHDPAHGVQGLAVELRNGVWAFPCQEFTRSTHPEIAALISEVLDYDPKAHTGDRLMAMWIATEGPRRPLPKMQQGKVSRHL